MSAEEGIITPALSDDGKAYVTPTPGKRGWSFFATGAQDGLDGDDILRGEGDDIGHDFEGPDTWIMDVDFQEPVEIFAGRCYWDDGLTWDDKLTIQAKCPATALTPNAGSGNANLDTETGVIVPAAGDGDYDVDLSAAVPVPAEGAGYWDVDEDTGEVTPSETPGSAKWHLVAAEVLPRFCMNIDMGEPLKAFDVSSFTTEYIHQTWGIRVKVVKASAGAAKFRGYLRTFRKNVL